MQYWSLTQVLLWAMYCDTELLRSLFRTEQDEGRLISHAVSAIFRERIELLQELDEYEEFAEVECNDRTDLENSIVRDVERRYKSACTDLRRLAEAGNLIIYGKKNGAGDFAEIPSIDWTKLVFHSYHYPRIQIGVTSHEKDDGWPCWLDLRMERSVVQRCFPLRAVQRHKLSAKAKNDFWSFYIKFCDAQRAKPSRDEMKRHANLCRVSLSDNEVKQRRRALSQAWKRSGREGKDYDPEAFEQALRRDWEATLGED